MNGVRMAARDGNRSNVPSRKSTNTAPFDRECMYPPINPSNKAVGAITKTNAIKTFAMTFRNN